MKKIIKWFEAAKLSPALIVLVVAIVISVLGIAIMKSQAETSRLTQGEMYVEGVGVVKQGLSVASLSGVTTGLSVLYGNVGIGTTAPVSKLQLGAGNWLTLNASTAGSQVGINFYEAGTISATDVQYGGKIFYDEGNDALRIVTRENSVDKDGITISRSTGDVSIGRWFTSPGYKLHVQGSFYVTTDALFGGNIDVNNNTWGTCTFVNTSYSCNQDFYLTCPAGTFMVSVHNIDANYDCIRQIRCCRL